MNKKYRVAQIGTFDVENYGDLLFPVLFKYRFSDYDIDLFSPKGGKKPFEKNTIVYSLDDLDKMCLEKKYDALVIGGGDLIRLDNQVANVYKKSYVSSLSLWLLPIVLGKKYNIPVVFNSPGVPYYFDLNQEKIIKTIMNSVDYISVRDRESKKILERAGIKNVNVVPDTILCIDKYITKSDNEKIKNQLIKDKKIPDVDNYIVIQHNKSNINNKLYIKEIKKLIDLIIKKYKYNVLLLPIGYVHNDIDFLNNIYNEKNKNLYIVKNKLTPEEMLSVLSCSKGYVGTSMHGAVTTYVYGNPIMIINVKKLVKIGGILEQINCKKSEVNNIYDLCSKFEKNFFDSYNGENHKNVKKSIENHFKIINNNVEKDVKPIINYERDVLLTSIEELSKYNETTYDFANVYFDYGEGFNEEEKIVVPITKSNGYKLSFDIPSNALNIRIDLIEGKYQKINMFDIKVNNEELNGEFLESLNINDSYYFKTTDPKIIVKLNDNSSNKKAVINFDGMILGNDSTDNYMDSIFNDLESLASENYSLKYNIENKMKYKAKYKIKKFIKKIIRKS